MLRSIYKDGADDGIVDESSMIEDVLICKLANLKIAGAGQCYKLQKHIVSVINYKSISFIVTLNNIKCKNTTFDC